MSDSDDEFADLPPEPCRNPETSSQTWPTQFIRKLDWVAGVGATQRRTWALVGEGLGTMKKQATQRRTWALVGGGLGAMRKQARLQLKASSCLRQAETTTS